MIEAFTAWEWFVVVASVVALLVIIGAYSAPDWTGDDD